MACAPHHDAQVQAPTAPGNTNGRVATRAAAHSNADLSAIVDPLSMQLDGLKVVANTTIRVERPRCTFLEDYPLDGNYGLDVNNIAVSVRFPLEVESRLPANILSELDSHSVDAEQVQVFLYAQVSFEVIGETRDHRDGSTLTTRLKCHNWADPDRPYGAYRGTHLQRDFLMGIFDSDIPQVADEVQLDRMLPFNVHTHDSMLSPRTAGIKLPTRDAPFSFWSLVIDHHPPEGHPRRAIATLHWLLDRHSAIAINREMTGQAQVHVVQPINFNPHTWGQFYHFMQNDPVISTQPVVHKLGHLTGHL